ncbi:MAG: Methyltransferase domain [Streptosporangiaceae bacterium]|nr:Methyltransferase domain [Streptosporangiaceae bacterium]
MNGFTDDPRHAEDLHAWQVLRPLLDEGNYLPWSTGAMRPAGLALVCNEIVHRGSTRIAECGSGVSTVVLARLLRQRGGGATIVALEHDAQWAALVTDLLRRESLNDVARVVHAPLEDDPPWYARSALREMPEQVDLLIVDGPPAYEPGHGRRRAPALAAFGPLLPETATVILDDVNRPGERDVLTAWESETSWRFSVDEAAGVATGRRSTDI